MFPVKAKAAQPEAEQSSPATARRVRFYLRGSECVLQIRPARGLAGPTINSVAEALGGFWGDSGG